MESTVVPVWEKLQSPELEALNDFRVFLFLVWRHVNLPKPTDVQLDIAAWLQEGPRQCNGRLIIEAFRGVGKTWITAAYVCWCLLHDPNLRILVVSKTGEKAKEIISFIKRLIYEMPVLQHLDPRQTSRNTTEHFDVMGATADVQPSVKALGITGQLPGNRADILIPDDVETTENCLTQYKRERLDGLVAEFDAILKPGGMIVYLGTPQIEDSLYSRRANAGYTVRIWPGRFPTTKQMENEQYRSRLAPWITSHWTPGKVWKTTDPKRFSDADLDTRELSYGKAGFLLQFMLDTSLSDVERYPLRLRDLVVMAFSPDSTKCPVSFIWSNDPKYMLQGSDDGLPVVGMTGDRYYRPANVSDLWEDYERTTMSIDPSGSGKDETAYAVGSLYKGFIYLRASGGFLEGHSPATMEALVRTAQRFKVNRIRLEKNFGKHL